MDFNFPSININIINELNDLYDQIIEFKKINKKQEEVFSKALLHQNQKIEIIHELFNSLRKDIADNNSDNRVDILADRILKSKRMEVFEAKLSEIKDIYNECKDVKFSTNDILEKSYDKLIFLNKNFIDSYNRIDQNNKELLAKVNMFENHINTYDVKIETMNSKIINLINQHYILKESDKSNEKNT